MAVGVFLWRVTQKTGGRGTSFPHRGVFLQPFQIAVLISLCINALTGSKNNTNRQNGKCAFAGTSTQVCSRMVAADPRRPILARKTLPPRYLGGYGACNDS